MHDIVIATPSTLTLQQRINALALEANGFVVNSPQTYTLAAERLVNTRRFCQSVVEMLDPPVKIAYQAHKDMVANRKKFLDPAKQIADSYNDEMTRWTTEQEQKRLEAKAELRAKAAADAEKIRLEEAVRMEDAGDKEGADRILKAPIIPAQVMLPIVIPKTPGLTEPRVIWKGRIINAALVPPEGQSPDQVKIDKFAALHGPYAAMDGVEFYSKTSRRGVRV